MLFILLLVLQFAATMPRRCVLEKILVTGQLLLSERFSWKIGALGTEGGRVNNNKISNYLAQTNYRLDVRLGFPDYVTAYAPHNLQGRLEHFSCLFHLLYLCTHAYLLILSKKYKQKYSNNLFSIILYLDNIH